MSKRILKFPESVLHSIIRDGDHTHLRFEPMRVVKAEGVPDVDPSTLWDQTVEFKLLEADIEINSSDLPCKIASGMIEINGMTYVDIIPVPLSTPGTIEIELSDETGARFFLVRAERIDIELIGLDSYIKHT